MNYCNKNNHLQRIPVAAKNVDHTSGMAGEKLKSFLTGSSVLTLRRYSNQ